MKVVLSFSNSWKRNIVLLVYCYFQNRKEFEANILPARALGILVKLSIYSIHTVYIYIYSIHIV